MVDAIAKQEIQKSFIMDRQRIDMRLWLADLPHLWTCLSADAGLPPMSQHGHQPAPPRLPVAADAPDDPPMQTRATRISLSLATGNTNSLYTGPEGHAGKLGYLRQQMISHGLNILGLQETRTPAGLGQAEKVLRIASGSKGKDYGLELWVNLHQPIAHVGKKPLYFRKQNFVVVHSDPRLLLVHAVTDVFSCWLLVGHAPHSGRPAAEREAWWNDMTNVIQQHLDDAPLFAMLDANASSGPTDEMHVGPIDDCETPNTQMLRDFLVDRQLCLPSTFPIHEGPNATWTSPDGQLHRRIDYVMVPLSFLHSCARSIVVEDFDLGLQYDHQLTAVDLVWHTHSYVAANAGHRHHSRTPQLASAQIKCIPPSRVHQHAVPDWHCDIGAQVDRFNQHVQDVLQDHDTLEEHPWKKPYLDDDIWHVRAQKIAAKKALRLSQLAVRQHLLIDCFAGWKRTDIPAGTVDGTAEDPVELQCANVKRAAALWRLTQDLRTRLRKAKTTALQQCLEQLPSSSSAATILKSLRPHIGPTNPKKIKKAALPMIRQADGEICKSPAEALDGWIEHFMTMEGGARANGAEQQRLWIAALTELRADAFQLTWDQLPSLLDLEEACRQVALDKATGPDQVPSSFVHIHSKEVAKLLYPQLLKLLLHGQEALIHKGGRLAIAYKGKGAFDNCEAYRSLLVSSHPGKTLHKTLRSSCTSIFDAYMQRQQLGGRRFVPVTFAVHLTRAYLRANQHQQRSVAILFLDLKEAFYRIVRGIVIQAPQEDDMLAHLAQRLGLPDDALHELHSLLANGDALTAAAMPMHFKRAVRALHEDTHFHLPGQQDACRTRVGTRPGDSWADIIFSFAWARLLHGLHAELHERGILDAFSSAEQWSPFPAHHHIQGDRTPFLGPTWMDDLSLAVSGGTALEAESRIGQATSCLLERCANFGMTPNLAKGKTEILLSVRGPGSRKVRMRYFGGSASGKMPIITQYKTEMISVTGEYVHLGNLVHHTGHSGREMSRRLGIAHQAYAAHRRAIYANPSLSLSRRREMFETLILTKLMYGAETWTPATWKEKEHMHAGIMRLYKRLCKVSHDAPVRDEDVLCMGGLLSPSELLRRQRLRYLPTLFRCGALVPWELLTADEAWCELLRGDLQWMYTQLWNASSLPSPETDFGSWHTILVHYPGYWKRLLRRCCEHAKLQREREHHARQLHCDVLTILRDHGDLCVPPPAPTRLLSTGVFGCLTCKVRCKSYGGGGAHMFRTHGLRAPHRRFCEGTQCSACLKEYHTIGRLQHHLRSSVACRQVLISRGFWNTEEPGEGSTTHIQQERQHNGVQLAQQAAGPLLPTQPPRPEPARVQPECYDLLSGALLTHTADDFEALCRELPTDFTLSWSLFTSTLSALWSSIAPDDWGLIRATEADLAAVFRRLQDPETWQLLHDPSNDTRDSCSHLDLYDMETLMLKIAENDNGIWQAPVHVERPRFAEKVILHAFSGRRRRGDLQDFIDKVSLTMPTVHLTVVSLDIVVNEQLGDVRMPETKAFWLRGVREGFIVAMVAGPPCNTWSAARSHDVKDKKAARHVPRVVRPPEEAWGMHSLSLRELLDVCVGNDLFIFTLYAFVLLFFNAGLSIVEHPDEPKDLKAVSVWRLPIMQVLLCLPGVELHHIMQGLFGAESPKPTGFLTLNLPHFRTTLHKRRLTTQLPMASSIGVTETGEFKTAKLKEYPPALCAALSQCLLDALSGHDSSPDCDPLPSDFKTCCDMMVCNEYGNFLGPDFAGS